MAEILLEPSSRSKIIPLSFDLNDTSASNAAQLMTKRQFNTADTDAWFQISLDDFVDTAGSFDITLFNLNDKSVFNHTGKPFTTNPFYYKLDSESDETKNEIRHAGIWIGQIVVTLANGNSATRKFIFDIEGHILDGADVQTILLEDYNALIATINTSKDLLAQYNVDYAALIADVTTAEGVREQAEIDRAAVFAALVESEMVAQNVATKLAEKEATFAPRMLSLESELADVAEQLSATNQPIVDTGNYFSADNTNAALQELGAHKASTENPHGVTKTQVGLGSVDNTSDANKPVSTATQTALNLKANKVQEAWITPTLLNGWVNFDSGYASCQYRIDSLGTVHLKGMIRNGTLGTPCFTLALGYRPTESQYHLSLSSDNARTLTITSSGDVRISSVASKSWVSFNGITFKI